MPNTDGRAFDITPTPASLALDANREGEVAFTVTSRKGRLRTRVQVEPESPAGESWFEVVGEPERTLDLTDTFGVRVKVPPTAEAGDYSFRLKALSELNPDEDFAESAAVGFTVAPRDEPKKSFPLWIVLAIVGVLIVGGLVAWLLLRDSGVTVPDVVEETLEDATEAIEDAGLVVGDPTREFSETEESDVVISQEPEGGEKVAEGSEVSLTVSKGPAVSTELDTNRPGFDYHNFELPAADPALCARACADDANCLAYTYVKPGLQGPAARCWLKNPAPAPQPNACCVSGIKAGATSTDPPDPITTEPNVNRPGSDYSDFDLAAADPALCTQACLADANCKAYTYVKPGLQGPAARCWLKNPAPAPQPNNCCVSGIKTG